MCWRSRFVAGPLALAQRVRPSRGCVSAQACYERGVASEIQPGQLIEQSLVDLEWPIVLRCIASRARGELGRRLCEELRPCEAPEEVQERQATLQELLTLFEQGAGLPAREVPDIQPLLARIEKGGGSSGVEMAQVLGLLRAADLLIRFARAHRETAPVVARLFEMAPELRELEQSLSLALSDDGQILDQAEPALAEARSGVRALRRRLQSRINDLISRYRDALQDGFFTEREGRFVLPVRADAPYRVEGFVFGTSQSGSTLYVEPRELAQLGHELRMAEAQVERVEAQVLAKLCAQVIPWCEELAWAQECCGRADLLAAIVDFSSAVGARVVPLSEREVIHLRGARHPLLVESGVDVVENDLEMQSGRGVVVSGPNAGGKTVALKSVGLLTVMQSAGLPLPVAPESEMGFFPVVLADIGDDQSLSRSLSTFSGHVERVRDFLDQASTDTLVLLDELMGGTDPGEGTVLAMATLEAFVDGGAAVMVTTHYDGLKDFALGHEKLESAAVGFDFSLMEPTFRVEMGRPGASSALHVARRHGLPNHVTDRAEAFLPELDARVRQDRIEIEQMRVELDRQRGELAEQAAESERLNLKKQRELQLLEEARRRDLGRESDELRTAIREARGELRTLRKKLKASPSAQELREIERGIDQVSSHVSLGSAIDQTLRKTTATGESDKKDEKPAPPVLQVGMKVKLRGMRGCGEVIDLPRKGQVRVLMGGLKLNVPTKEIEAELDSVSGRAAGERPARSRPTSSKHGGAKRSVSSEAGDASQLASPVRSKDVILDLRGKRVEPSLDELDVFIDELLRRQEIGGFVLHGHGTGAMKEAVRSHLRGHRCIRESRAAERSEGGDALTVFWLESIS